MPTPYFPAWRSRLAALGRRTAQTVRQATLVQLQEHLREFLPAPLLAAEDDGPNSRERVFSLRLTFECFVWQLLKPKTSCREVVRQVQALFCLHGRGPVDERDSAYVQARLRLPRERLEKALNATAQAADRRAGSGGQLQGRPVKVVDGSTTQLADTAPNQERYPQPTTQKPGCGFPVLKLAVLFSLTSGAILHVLCGTLRHHDLRLLRGLWNQLAKGDILLGDRAYGEYTTLAGLPQQGVDVVARLHQRRQVDFRKARRLGHNDGLFVWTKGCQPSKILSATQWALLPAQITVRILRFTATIRGFRSRRITLVTTLLDPELFPARDLVGLYARRWRLELCLRDLKTTMGMEHLRCKTPDMVEKELLAYLVAHNAVRCVMAEALARYTVDLERISFKGSLDALRQYSDAIGKARNRKIRRQLWEDLLLNLARDLVRYRPHRTEPRAVKRRPKSYPLLNQPRRRFKDVPHRNRYWKGHPRELPKPYLRAILTLKEGRQPTTWEETIRLLPLHRANRVRHRLRPNGRTHLQDFRWVENVMLLGEITPEAASLYAYITNFPNLSPERVAILVLCGGRERHRIEDTFNTQKNNGIGLEHVFCAKANASKNYYTMMQVAQILWILTCKGCLQRLYDWARRATEQGLARALWEGLCARRLPPDLPLLGQIRFSSA